LRTYVSGSTPLPLEEVFESVGIIMQKESIDSAISLGIPQQQLTLNSKTGRIKMVGVAGMNAMGKALGFKAGDELVAINGQEIGPQNIGDVVGKWRSTAKAGDLLTIQVARDNESGTEEKVDLKANLFNVAVKKEGKLLFDPKATPAQLTLRKAWLDKAK
jgi:predicted metalloprotease with PDZ domain